MSGVAAAVGIGTAVIGAGAQMYSSSKSSKAQKNALQQQGQTSEGNYAVDRTLFQPFVDSGTSALGTLQNSVAKPYTETQLAEANAKYARDVGAYQNRLNDREKVKAWFAFNMPTDAQARETFLAQNYPEMPEPVKPTNEGRGELSQRTNMTPQEFFASEAAAGRPVPAEFQNWNTQFSPDEYLAKFGKSEADMFKDFDQAAYLQSQGKSPTALNENFDMNAWLKSQGRGTNALTRDFTLQDFQEDPSYAYRLAQGNRSLENSASARGSQLSGATLKALATFNQNEASQEYQNAVSRYNVNRQNLQNVGYNAQGQFNTDRANLVANTGNAQNLFGMNRENLINNTRYAQGQFTNNQNAVYGKFVDAYGRQSNAKQLDYGNLFGLSNQGLIAASKMSQAGMSNTDNQMGAQAGIGNGAAQQSINTGNMLSGLAGTVGGVATNYLKNQPIASNTPYNPQSSNALTGYTPYQPANFNLF